MPRRTGPFRLGPARGCDAIVVRWQDGTCEEFSGGAVTGLLCSAKGQAVLHPRGFRHESAYSPPSGMDGRRHGFPGRRQPAGVSLAAFAGGSTALPNPDLSTEPTRRSPARSVRRKTRFGAILRRRCRGVGWARLDGHEIDDLALDCFRHAADLDPQQFRWPYCAGAASRKP